MAEKQSTVKRPPRSLNDSHYRFLQDLSAPPKPKPSDGDFEDSEDEKSRLKMKIDGGIGLSEAVSGDSVVDVPSFSVFADFDTPPEQEKPIKVKIKGRRRLCKLSSQVNKESPEEILVPDEPTFSDIADFESPPPPHPRVVNDSDKNGGDNEIRDILNDLGARLEFLSIEKRKDINKTNTFEGSLPVFKYNKEIDEEKKVDLPEYASAESSFSLASDASDSSSDAAKNDKSCTERVDCEYVKDRGLHYEHESEVSSKTDHSNVGGNFMPKHSFVSHVKEVEDSRHSEQKGGNHVGRKHVTAKHDEYKKSEFSRIDKKLVRLGKSSTYQFGEREDSDEDDCVVLSGNKIAKEVGRKGKMLKERDVSNGDDIFKDDSSITLPGSNYTYNLHGDVAKMLYPHQRDGLKWLWSLHCQGKGGILGDDMGLGKTMQICGFLAGLFHSRLIKRALIVAPKTLLSHWIKELSVVGLSDKTREYFGTCAKTRQYELQYVLQDKGILLTTYDIVRANTKSLQGDKRYNYFDDDDESEDNVTWDYMILDEGHLIKNPSTQRAKSLLVIPSAHRIIISGTPIQNNLKELWALFNFCCPELLGDKQGFKERFENAILRGNDKNASERERRIGSEVAKELRECIRPYFLRRMKSEIFNEDANEGNTKLSKKNEMIVWLRLTTCQRQLYEAFLKSELVLSAFDGSPLAALTILKKICDHPLLLTKRAAEDVLEEMDSMLKPEDINVAEKLAMYIADAAETDGFEENHVNISCKISFILSLLEDLIPKGHNVLIFSQTRKMLNLIQDSLVSNGYEYMRIDGTTKATDRVKIVDDFQNGGGPPIFLLTSQVGGLGLTLTRADRVIVVDPAWNPSTDNQSVDRAYRIGQTKDVLVYRLMTCGTVEEKIYRKQIYKGGLFRTATEHKEQTRYFCQNDLQELFSLPAQGFDVSLTQQQLHEEHDRQHIVDDDLKAHIEFLESQGIAGVSHHSLLFSKEAPAQDVQGEEEVRRKPAAAFVGALASSVSIERSIDGAGYAFNPKDIRLNKKTPSPDSEGKLTESEIKERISRLSNTLANKAMVSRLPDNGQKIQIQIAELSAELHRIKMKKENKKEVIDLDSLTSEFNKVLNV
ncbi:protein CHROMATIN REMODELING 24 [Morus notabilis]|uniref:protein CHROMATIN REMODELING 24 n=1 Tax=Morus notabilis TaxID=981085 RepID=UPI000CED2052|nr:protein CHROMATIN REMODELING 24 [Morus notabilis]